MCKRADLVAVSSANGEAVDAEWTKHGLKEDCRVLLCQEAGSKAYCIQEMVRKGYDVDLSNGFDIEFDKHMNVREIDR